MSVVRIFEFFKSWSLIGYRRLESSSDTDDFVKSIPGILLKLKVQSL